MNVVEINGCVMMANVFQEIENVMFIGLIVMMDLMKRTVKTIHRRRPVCLI